jgi:hypothetical protein
VAFCALNCCGQIETASVNKSQISTNAPKFPSIELERDRIPLGKISGCAVIDSWPARGRD